MRTNWYRPILRCTCLFLVGASLQFAIGDCNNGWLRYPWSAILAINYLYLLVVLYAFENRWSWVRRLRDGYSSVVSLFSMVVMTIIFGLTRQDGATEGVCGVLGFTRMTSSWPFNLLLLNFITTLGLAVIDDWRHFSGCKLARLLSHTAIFIALAAALFGSGDKLRVRLNTLLDRPAYEAVDDQGRAYDLPFSITLKEFNIEEYAPQLYLYNLHTEKLSTTWLSLLDSVGEIDHWRLRVEEYLPMAGYRYEEGEYRAMQHVGATHAVKVIAENTTSGVEHEGWVSCGSHIFNAATLNLGGGEVVVMPQPKAKSYLSRIAIEGSAGDVQYHDVRVNHPAKIGAWRIYQVGYDTELGRWSTSSMLECVRDGWWRIVSVALWMTLAAAVAIFITAGGGSWRRKTIKEDKR